VIARSCKQPMPLEDEDEDDDEVTCDKESAPPQAVTATGADPSATAENGAKPPSFEAFHPTCVCLAPIRLPSARCAPLEGLWWAGVGREGEGNPASENGRRPEPIWPAGIIPSSQKPRGQVRPRGEEGRGWRISSAPYSCDSLRGSGAPQVMIPPV
jgi:hypothetical protein